MFFGLAPDSEEGYRKRFSGRVEEMARICAICGKGSLSGNVISHHGKAKKDGGIGLHTTGVNRRKFRPNLHRIRIVEHGRVLRRLVCAACIRSGKVVKP